MNSCISEMPGPDVAVKARAPFQPAPMTTPIDASSSSAWTIANLFFLLSASTLSRLQLRVKAAAGGDDGAVLAEFRRRQWLGRVVEQIAAGLDRGDVLVPGLRVHRHHEVDAAARREMAVARDAHLVPGRQALDVGREDVARAHRDAHAQHGAREQLVGARRAGAVDVGEADDEVGYAADRACRHGLPARVISIRYFFMSQAPVGQRSAHSPQCRQTSSSLTMTRPVLRSFATYRSWVRLTAGACSRVRSSASSPFSVKVMQSIGQMSTQASHSMHSDELKTVCTSQFRQR